MRHLSSLFAHVTSVLIFNFTTVPECNRKCQESFREVRRISATSVPDTHRGPVNKLYLTLSECKSLFFLALQITCGKTMRRRLELWFSTPLIMRSNAAWLPWCVNSSGFPLATYPLQVISLAQQRVAGGSRLAHRDHLRWLPDTPAGLQVVEAVVTAMCFGKIKEEWRPLLELLEFAVRCRLCKWISNGPGAQPLTSKAGANTKWKEDST